MTTPTAKNSIDQAKLHRESMAIAPQAPGIIPFMEEEVVNFEGESASFQAGEQDNAEFTPFRLKQGVYGQRQADVQMIRVKIPGGILNATSLDGLGIVADKYAPLGQRPHHHQAKRSIPPHPPARMPGSPPAFGDRGIDQP